MKIQQIRSDNGKLDELQVEVKVFEFRIYGRLMV
jgi:hypothetical protein